MRSEMPLTAPFFGLYPGGMESRLAESGDGERELPRRDVPSTRAFTTVYAPVDLPAPGTVPEGVVQAPALPGGDAVPHIAPRRALHGRVVSGWCSTATCSTATSRACAARSRSHFSRFTRRRPRGSAWRMGSG